MGQPNTRRLQYESERVDRAWQNEPEYLGNAPAQATDPVGEHPYSDAWHDRITMEFRETPFRKVLARLYRGSHLQYAVNPDVPDLRVTLSIQGLPRQVALNILSRWMRARLPTFLIDTDNELWIYKRYAPSVRGVTDPPRSELADWDSRISVAFRETPLRKALAILYADSYFGYAVQQEVPDVPITLSLQDVPRKEVLQALQSRVAQQVPTFTVDAETEFRVYRLRERRSEAAEG